MARPRCDVASMARAHTLGAIRTLARVMNQPKGPAAARVAAAQALLDRGWGKSVQLMDIVHRRVAADMSDDELIRIIDGGVVQVESIESGSGDAGSNQNGSGNGTADAEIGKTELPAIP